MAEKNIFDWSDKAKEPFMKEAGRIINASDLKGIIEVDTKAFGISEGKYAKVFIVPILIKGNMRIWSKAKSLDKFVDETGKLKRKNEVGMEKPLFYKGSFKFNLSDYGYKF